MLHTTAIKKSSVHHLNVMTNSPDYLFILQIIFTFISVSSEEKLKGFDSSLQ
jgi:hypothetical protein